MAIDVSGPALEQMPVVGTLLGESSHQKGTAARLKVTGEPLVLPAGLELSVYRVVEHLLGATGDEPAVQSLPIGASTRPA